MPRFQITVSKNADELINRAVKELQEELGEGVIVRKGYAIGEILQRYFDIVKKKKKKD